MPRKPTGYERFDPQKGPNQTDLNWHSDPTGEFYLYARQYHIAAKKLLQELEPMPDSIEARACVAPVVLLYRKAVEQYLKAMILGDGSNFIVSPTHPLTVFRSQSLRWLSRLVCKIIKTLHLQRRFVCDGVKTLRDFRRIIDQLDKMADGDFPDRYQDMLEFSWQMDAILNLIDATASQVTQRWDMWARTAAEKRADGSKGEFR